MVSLCAGIGVWAELAGIETLREITRATISDFIAIYKSTLFGSIPIHKTFISCKEERADLYAQAKGVGVVWSKFVHYFHRFLTIFSL